MLLFSQFTMMLDILEVVLDTLGVDHIRLDGSTTPNERQGLIDLYQGPAGPPVFLLSTKAGEFQCIQSNYGAYNNLVSHFRL